MGGQAWCYLERSDFAREAEFAASRECSATVRERREIYES
jgi:hypothetical protein